MKQNSRQLSAEKTKERIYKTAIRLFRKNGYAKVSVNDIVKAAEVSRATFYMYFQSKGDLLAETLFDMNKEYYDYYEKLLTESETKDKSPLELLELFLREVNQIMTRNGHELLRMYYRHMFEEPVLQRRKDFHYARIVRELISKCREEHLLNHVYDNEQILEMAIILNRGICTEWSMYEDLYPVESRDGLITSFCSLLKQEA